MAWEKSLEASAFRRRSIHDRVIQPKTMIFRSSSNQRELEQPELRLPNNLALGFSLVLGGSLLCVLPFGFTQGAGISLITSGIVIAAQGAAQGEKPYFIDSETGQRLPYNHPNSGPSIGAGTNF